MKDTGYNARAICHNLAMPSPIRYRRILVGVDFSKPSEAAYRHGLALAKASGATIEVVHVAAELHAALPFSPENRAVVAQLQKDEIAAAAARLARLTAGVRKPRVATRVMVGDPAEKLIARARSTKADVIVVANRGQRMVEKLLLGSTAERVLRRSRRPVLLVPAP